MARPLTMSGETPCKERLALERRVQRKQKRFGAVRREADR
jgi:hypothetical protein